MRVAFVSTCGAGHLNTIRSIWEGMKGAHLFLVRFRDEPVPFENHDRVTVITMNEDRPSEEARLFNTMRYRQLRDALHVWMYDFAPTLIVYDFFCLEAYHVSRVMGIPAICSIPATLKPYEKETCSDAILPKEHFYWVWREPYPVAISPVAFLGPARRHAPKDGGALMGRLVRASLGCTVVVVTFGTVIPTYAGCQERLADIMSQIKIYIRNRSDMFVIYAGIQGPDLPNCASLRYEECHLPTLLSACHVHTLIFHGGGNTYAEALAARVPRMLVCPFFGDQFETALQCGNMFSGNLAQDMANLQMRVYSGGHERPTYTRPFEDRFPDYWRPGDLLFGHRRHRAALQKAFPQVNLHLEHYAAFGTFAAPEKGDLPAIADVYNDQLGSKGPGIQTGDESPFGQRLVQVAEKRKESAPDLAHLSEEHRLVHYCLQILDVTIKAGNKIHFVLGPLGELGPATEIELTHIRQNWDSLCDRILFYDLEGRRIAAPLKRPTKPPSKPPIKIDRLLDDDVSRSLEYPGRVPFLIGRCKTSWSIAEKRVQRKLPVLDCKGWRTTYVNKEDLKQLQAHLWGNWLVSVNWCKQHVWYYYYPANRDSGETTELQVWPHVYLHCFYLNQAGQETDRDAQFRAQDAIDNEHF